MGRGDTSDSQWKLIEPLLPKQKRGGKWNDHRLMFDGILWVLRTGAPWRDLPERYGKWQSVYHRFNRWKKDGTLDRILKALRIRLDKEGYIDWELPPRAPASLEDGAAPTDYPLSIPSAGVLVDDPASRWDVAAAVRQVLGVIWGDGAAEVESEICHALTVGDIRGYLRARDGFFGKHLSRYSQSRRQAPIYWPVSTESGAYTVWLYYHALTDQTLFGVINDHLDPKIVQVSSEVAALRARTSRSSVDERRLSESWELETELRELRSELLEIASRWRPNLNDGVVITASPLWRFCRHKPWQKVLRETWAGLEAGEYDWSHLAYSLWPERVREKCKRDKSLAIAHGLEELYQEPPAAAGRKRGRKPKVADPELLEDAE